MLAAFGPIDVVGDAGALSENLREAALAALSIDRQTARDRSLAYSWQACAELFIGHVRDVHRM